MVCFPIPHWRLSGHRWSNSRGVVGKGSQLVSDFHRLALAVLGHSDELEIKRRDLLPSVILHVRTRSKCIVETSGPEDINV
ncbi:hypothetical protein AKJ16_DCAP10692 [Drosera capensis]